MCGRFAFKSDSDWERAWGLTRPAPLLESYNIAPSQAIPVVRQSDAGRLCALMHWGLIPAWATDKRIGYKTFNARGETVKSKPAFRAAYKSRRCLVPADGFFEWQRDGKQKRPFCFRARGGAKLALAGLWERWTDRQSGEIIESATLITMPATEQMAGVHHRMPVLVSTEHFAPWLLAQLEIDRLMSANEQPLLSYEVDARVNNARHDEAANLAPLS